MKKQVFNPYLPSWEYIPDGEPRVFGERLYIFGSHDNAKGKDYCVNDYVTWSAPINDLSDWRYEGVIFKKSQTPWNTDEKPMYAPDVAKGPDGRYYLYYSVQNTSIMSVAVCDSPAGRYEYYGDVKMPNGHVLGHSKEDWFQFDPSILVDNDGRIFLYSGSGQNFNKRWGYPVVGCFVMELEQDMLTVKGSPKILLPAKEKFTKPNFFEGASVRHIGELYYLVFPATDISGLNYATSKYPDRDFTYRGRIHSTSDIGYEGHSLMEARYPIGNNHGGLVEINGEWYVFDHRQTDQSGWRRQGVAEKIEIKPDGSIAMVDATSCGLNNGPLSGDGLYPAYIACNLMSKATFGLRNPTKGPFVTQEGDDYNPPCEKKQESANGGIDGMPPVSYISGIKNGCVVGYKYFDLRKTRHIRICIRGKAAGRLILSDQEDGRNIRAYFDINSSKDWMEYDADIEIIAERTPLYFIYSGRGMIEFLSFTLS